LSATDGICTSSYEINVVFNDAPTLSQTDDIIYIPKGITDYHLTVDAGNFDEYRWTTSNSGLTLPVWPDQPSPSPVILASPDDIFQLTLTLWKGDCMLERTIKVDYALDLFIPNFFTPNGSEPNNYWRFRNIEKWNTIFDIHVEVFTRNNALVYSVKGYDNVNVVWDGRRNGENVPIGTYYYVVTLRPKSATKVTPPRPITGLVMIMR